MRGNPDNLRLAAARKSTAAHARAEQGLREMLRRGEPITFRGLAATAGVSLDFLYRTSDIRRRANSCATSSKPPRPRGHPASSPSSQHIYAPSLPNSPNSNAATATRSKHSTRHCKPRTARTSNCDVAWATAPNRPDGQSTNPRRRCAHRSARSANSKRADLLRTRTQENSKQNLGHIKLIY